MRLEVHPVERYQEAGVHFEASCSVHELALDVVVVCFLVVRDEADVLVKFAKLRRKNIGWKQLFGLNFELVVHHFLKAFLVGLVTPRKLAETEVGKEVKQRLNVVLLEVFFVWQVGC